jgi:hypothetical protein
MKSLLVLWLSGACCMAQIGQDVAISTWSPRSIVKKAGVIAYYDPGYTNSLMSFNGSGVVSMSNLVETTTGIASSLSQTISTNQPYLTNAVGGRSVLYFNGTSHHLLTPFFTLHQPEELYLSFSLVSWVLSRRLFDGRTVNSGTLYETPTTPSLTVYSGVAGPVTTGIGIGAFHVARVRFNGTNSAISVDNGADVSSDAGTNSMGGFVVGANGALGLWANIEVATIILCNKTNNVAESNYLIWGQMKQLAKY